MTGEIVKDLCQQDLRLGDDVDAGWQSAQEEARGLTKEAEERGNEAIEDEVDLGVELVGSDLRTSVAVFRGGGGEDELTGWSEMR